LILVIGGVLVFTAIGRAGRERVEMLAGLRLGQPAARATELVGIQPTVCPPGSLEHLRASFPEGWPAGSIDVALEQLSAGTTERWVYPVGRAAVAPCVGDEARTEIGVTPDGRVLWSVAVIGRTPLQMPAELAPAGVEVPVEDST
jgi:hypothetical protein